MKRLNRKPRELRPISIAMHKWMSELPLERQIIHVKSYGNMQLKEVLGVSKSNRMQIELKIYKLKQENKCYDKEIILMQKIDQIINNINKALEENNEYISKYFGYEFK